MPNISKSAQEQTHNSPIEEAVEQALSSISVTTVPVFICGVNRKANIGNYENIDVYSGLALPLTNESLEDLESLQDAIKKAAELGFAITSSETFQRYSLIKDAQNEGRA
jgi:predicted aldo/keto reductase-like oxidoreductase